MKKVTSREFARKQGQLTSGLKARQTVAVTEHGKAVFPVSKPEAASRRRLHAKQLLKALAALPMTEAEGDRILKDFAREAVF